MSEIDDALAFVAEIEKREEGKKTEDQGLSIDQLNELMSSERPEKEIVKPGQPSQYELYGGGYMPSSETVKTLPSGSYHVAVSNSGVYVTPSLKQGNLLLDLPEMKSDDVLKVIDRFWTCETDYKDGNDFVVGGAPYKGGVLIYGPPGCHAKGTDILMFNGTMKKVEDVEVGDQLMGPDSKPREVLKLQRGQEKMVRITPTKGEPFVINQSHILHLTPSGSESITQTPLNIKFKDWLEQKNNFKERYKLTRTGVNFEEKTLPIDPYLLGMWLGDGTSHITDITTADNEVVSYLQNYAQDNNYKLVARPSIYKGKAATYGITNGKGQKNPLLTALQELELIKNKHIPLIFKTASRNQRLSLLAGLLDSDGNLGSGVFDFISKLEVLSDDIIYMARSLGFSAYKAKCEKSCQNGFTGTYYRVCISGNIDEIPCLLPRKQAEPRKQIKSVLRTGFTYEILPEDNFYGFTLDGDHLYLTGDFTIHHNSGKSCTIKIATKRMVERGGVVFYGSNPVTLGDFLTKFAKIEPNRKSVVIFEDIDSLVEMYGESGYLDLLDSANSINNVFFIATTNYPEKLDPRIYNRPGRFSHVIKIGFPSAVTRAAYLKAILKNHQDIQYIVDNSDGFTIDHLTALTNAVYREKKDLEAEIKRLRSLFKIPSIVNKQLGIGLDTIGED
jgi:hypothetical protein